jgi:hypothetical protein
MHDEVARAVYEATDRGVRYMAVQAVARSVLRARHPLGTEQVTSAMVALYRAGKPITITTVCQVLDGALRLPGYGYNDRTAGAEGWANGTLAREWESLAP